MKDCYTLSRYELSHLSGEIDGLVRWFSRDDGDPITLNALRRIQWQVNRMIIADCIEVAKARRVLEDTTVTGR